MQLLNTHLSSSLKKQKESTPKKFLIFQEMELSSSKIKKILLFPKMELSYISGNETF